MAETRTVQGCLWAEPTLFLAHPFWIDAENYPWSCRASGQPQPVPDTMACRSCARWTAHGPMACRDSGGSPAD